MVSYMVDRIVGNVQVPRDIVVVWNVMVVTMLLDCVARHLDCEIGSIEEWMEELEE